MGALAAGLSAWLAGVLGTMFGVCCNELSADGHVVDFEYGCGAHSDTPAPAGAGSPMYEPYDDGVVEILAAADLVAAATAEVEAAEVAPEEVEVAADVAPPAETVETAPADPVEP